MRNRGERSVDRLLVPFPGESLGAAGTTYNLWSSHRSLKRDHRRRFNRSLCGVLLGVSIVLVILGILGIIGIAVYLGGEDEGARPGESFGTAAQTQLPLIATFPHDRACIARGKRGEREILHFWCRKSGLLCLLSLFVLFRQNMGICKIERYL